MANVSFKRGLQASLPTTNIVDGAFYLTTDTNRLYVGGANNKLELLNQSIKFYTYNDIFGTNSTVPKAEGQFYYLSDKNILCTYTKDKGWIQINPDTNDNTIVYASGLEVTKADSAVGEAKKLTYTIKLNQEKKEKTGDAVAYGEPVTASFEINSEDLNKIASNVSVGLESQAITNDANGFELKNSGGGADGAKAVQIKGGNNVTITRADDGNVTIAAKDTNTTYSMESPANSASILLKSDGAGDAPSVTFTGDEKVKVSGATAGEIAINHATSSVKAGDYNATDVDKTTNKFSVPQFSVDETGHVTAASAKEITIPAQHDTTYTIESINANTNGDLSVSLKADKGQAVTTTSEKALYYKVAIDDAPEAPIYNGNSLGSFYTAAKTKALIEDAKKTMDAMTYKGAINEEEFGVIAGSQKGDTYKASVNFKFTINGQSVKTGDLIIYKGADLAATLAPAATDWDIVPSGDETDSQFSLRGADDSIILRNTTKGADVDSVAVTGEKGIAATVASNTLTIGHTNTITAGAVGDNTNQTPNALGSIIVPSITYDAQGHITGAEDKTITLPADKDTTYQITTAKDDNNAVITLSEKGKDTLGGATTATFMPGDGITLEGAEKGITITHAGPGAPTGDSFGQNTSGQKGYGQTFIVPKISRDAKGHIAAIEDVEIQMPSAQEIPGVTFSGETSVADNRATFTSNLKVGETGNVQSFAPSIGSNSLKVSATGDKITMELEWGSF